MEKKRSKKAKSITGQKVKFFRERNGLSQAELASEADLDVTTIARIESGTRNPDKETLYLIASALKLNAKETAYLFDINIYAIEFKKQQLEK